MNGRHRAPGGASWLRGFQRQGTLRSGYIPEYLDSELHMKSAERRVTKTYLLLEALKKADYHVDDVDMVEDRRKNKQKGKV